VRNLLNFILKHHFVLLFIVFEIISFFFLIQFNNYQKSTFINSSNTIGSKAYRTSNSVGQYFALRNENILLNKALKELYSENTILYKNHKVSTSMILDSVMLQQYTLIPGLVINNSANKQNNYMTLNIGKNQGVDKGMAVISPAGIVGVIKDVSNNFSSVISLLNQNLRISALVKKNGYYGTLKWEGRSYEYASLYDLPGHININIGDTIITSGYSAIFPKGILIGTVSEIDNYKGGDFFKIRVKLTTNFKNISNIMVVKNLLKDEQLQLELKAEND